MILHARTPSLSARPRRTVLARCAAIAALVAATLAAPWAGTAVAASAADPLAPTLVTLKNGVRLLLAPDTAATAVDVAAWIDAGVRYERPGEGGVSHLLEHVATAAAAVDGVNGRRRIEAEGGTSTSYTAADFTCYSHTIPRAALEAAIRLEAARLALQPTQALLDGARARVRDEMRARLVTNPVERSLDAYYGAAFGTHPYRWPLLGADADLERVTLDQCRQYLKVRYTPDHLLLTVVGDFDPAEAVRLARRHLESIRMRGESRAPGAEPAPTAARRATRQGDYQVGLMAVGWTVATAPADAPALDLMSVLLAQGPLSRLNQRLVAGNGSCVFVHAGRDGRRDATTFWAVAALQFGADSAAVERDLIAEIEGLATAAVSDQELDRARRRLEVGTLVGRQSARGRGQALGTALLLSGEWQDADRQLERLRALTPADLQQVARRTFTPTRRMAVWLRAVPAGSAP